MNNEKNNDNDVVLLILILNSDFKFAAVILTVYDMNILHVDDKWTFWFAVKFSRCNAVINDLKNKFKLFAKFECDDRSHDKWIPPRMCKTGEMASKHASRECKIEILFSPNVNKINSGFC